MTQSLSADSKMKLLVFAHILVFLATATPSTGDQMLIGARSILPARSYGGYDYSKQQFFNKLGDDPTSSEAIIIGIDSINVSFYNQVESIQMTYKLSNGSLYTTPRYGGKRYKPFTIKLSPDEFIEKISGKTDGTCINEMNIHIRNVKKHEERILGPFGHTENKMLFSMEGHILGFHGTYDTNHLLGFGPILLSSVKQSAFFGTKPTPAYRVSGLDFDDHPDYAFSVPVAKITRIRITSDDEAVHALQVEYLLFDGRTVLGQWHGSNFTGSIHTIPLDESEMLTGVVGTEKSDHISQLTFLTWKRGGTEGKYGPYGSTNGIKPFSVRAHHILSFSGNAGYTLFGIGVYYDDYSG